MNPVFSIFLRVPTTSYHSWPPLCTESPWNFRKNVQRQCTFSVNSGNRKWGSDAGQIQVFVRGNRRPVCEIRQGREKCEYRRRNLIQEKKPNACAVAAFAKFESEAETASFSCFFLCLSLSPYFFPFFLFPSFLALSLSLSPPLVSSYPVAQVLNRHWKKCNRKQRKQESWKKEKSTGKREEWVVQTTYFGKTNDFAFFREQKVRYKVSTPVYIPCRLFRCLEETGGRAAFSKVNRCQFCSCCCWFLFCFSKQRLAVVELSL